MALAPGFLEWRKSEDRRIMDLLIKKFEDKGHFLVEPIIKDATYYERQAKNAHKMWEYDGFKLGPFREAYMTAHTELANFINSKNFAVGTANYQST
jgi:hypothetical protein